jgi:translocation protein SEC63
MSTEYNYDEQGQFFPYFILTITGLITLPLTYSAFRSSKELENSAPRIRSEFKPHHSDLIDAQKKSRKRRERKLKRMIFSGLGWLLMSWMVYLMVTTARLVPTVWDPYDVLGVTRVSIYTSRPCTCH